MPVWCGYIPVKIALRLGEQSGYAVKVFWKLTALFFSRSKWGRFRVRGRLPSQRSWSVRMKRMLGCRPEVKSASGGCFFLRLKVAGVAGQVFLPLFGAQAPATDPAVTAAEAARNFLLSRLLFLSVIS
jgi:hypothetical protein